MELLNIDFYRRHSEDLNRTNLRSLQFFSYANLIGAALNLLAQSLISKAVVASSVILLVYALLLFLVVRFFIPKDFKYATIAIYLSMVFPMGITLINGTVLDPEHNAFAFMLYIIAMPPMIMDYPLRPVAFTAAWGILLAFLSYEVKITRIFHGDAVHVLQAMALSIALILIVIDARIRDVVNIAAARSVSEHDELTAVKNRISYVKERQKFLGRRIILAYFDMDNMKLFNDFYGHQLGDEIMRRFAGILIDCFGDENLYRIGGDEFIVARSDISEARFKEKVLDCQNKLAHIRIENYDVHPTVSCGYTLDIARTLEELQDMARLADIRSYYAKQKQKEKIIGGYFDREMVDPKNIELEVERNATASRIDELTGLENMTYFMVHAEEAIQSLMDPDRHKVFLYFNIMHLKKFNEEFGYVEGDNLLKRMAEVLRIYFPNCPTARFAEDHYVVLDYRDGCEEKVERVATLMKTWKEHYPIEIKCGFYEYRGGDEVSLSCDHAKHACDSIKEEPGKFLCEYDTSFEAQLWRKHYVIDHLDDAIAQGNIQVYYQAIFGSVSNKLCNEEALVRWIDPSLGRMRPDNFIPILEKNRLTWKMDLAVVDEVIRGFDERKRVGMNLLPISVNLSRYDFENCDMVKEITDRMDAAGLPHNLMVIEITETAFTENQTRLQREIKRFHEAGFQVWMDDFGSGYSSLNLMRQFEFDMIKLDMDFVTDMDEKSLVIIKQIVNLARQLGIGTIAEGVETQEQAQALRDAGCEKMQGYYFSKPNSLEYIIGRAEQGVGLPFEDPAQSQYYELVGKVDLQNPLVHGMETAEGISMSSVATGVMEFSKDGNYVLRANERYASFAKEAGFVSKDVADIVGAKFEGVPNVHFQAAAKRAIETGDWEQVPEEVEGQIYVSAFLHAVATNPVTGATALLILVMSMSKESRKHILDEALKS